MPYDITWEPGGVVWTFHGNVTASEALRSNEDIYGDSRFDSLSYQIANFLGAQKIDFGESTIAQVAALDRAAAHSNPRIKVALVTNLEYMTLLADLYKVNSEKSPWSVAIFGKLEDAREWISSTPV